jgi:hypothetical protein
MFFLASCRVDFLAELDPDIIITPNSGGAANVLYTQKNFSRCG